MRPDDKVEGPRQSMSWLHTWASLILGWLLYAIFVTGTLSFFQNEITVWMKPELHQSVANNTQIQQTQIALDYLQKNHPHAGSWMITLPNSRQTTTEIMIRKQGEDPRARRGGERISLDSQTGEVLQARDTRGGSFLYRFHFELYGLPRLWTRWLVGLATMLMLVAIVSGIITHKKIFKDFFTFRSGKGQRSWLDAHNATAVFALPFHIMITFSGLLLLMFMFMPWGINQIYSDRQEFLKDLRPQINTQPSKPPSELRGSGRGEQERGEHGRHKREAEPQAAPMADLIPMLNYAASQWQNNPIGSIQIIAPNTTAASVEIKALYAESVIARNIMPTFTFNGMTGINTTEQNSPYRTSVPMGIYNVVTVLHEARGLDLTLRWLLFSSGILGTLMVATGLILWCVKRAPQQQKQGYKSFGYRLVEVTNITAIIGLPLACTGYFYANRLLPVQLETRLDWEINIFLITWLCCLIYAIFRTHRQAWLELLGFATIMFALLPVLNALTGGHALWLSIAEGQWMIASFDLMAWALAFIFGMAYLKVKNHKGLTAKKTKTAPRPQELTS
ncbi:PepSY-associated TM helix domain-containing protein [Acinetobacter sp. PK01]|uniref:PepSY-associated TM helix domain-containing protein n=1 Tax=Acinetobacter sp. PK01 TaxID=2930198 RepID=UPI001FB78932|nr:PepSY-associated TM helix domain-containing protein [Acinetobacter sp. PK01]UOG18524.1 PepSY domain-containing protein [Acinetobacter sp. PK01]